jgi:thiamine-phosphate pyrophosphorylase
MLLYYITDRHAFPGSEPERRRRLLAKIAEAARTGVDYIQLRERDLAGRELEALAREAIRAVREASGRTRLLINSRVDIAIAAGADGVHLRSDDIYASDARAVWASVYRGSGTARSLSPVIAVSCHTPEEVRLAGSHGADLAVFAPVFEKNGMPGVGLERLRAATQSQPQPQKAEGPGASHLRVLALGGVTLANARASVEAGASGIAAIRLFQENEVRAVVEALRG